MARPLWFPLVTLTLLAAGAAHAASPEDELRQRDDVIAELVRKVDVLTDEVGALRTQVAVPEEPELKSQYGFGPAASKVYSSQRGLSIGGYGEVNYTGFVSDKGDDDSNRSDAMRNVLYFGYKFSDSIVFNSEIEFENATTEPVDNGGEGGFVSVEFAAMDFLWRPEVNARAGLVLVPMGFINEIHEPPFFFGVFRPDVEEKILPATWRENGVGLFGKIGESLSYRAYVMSGFDAANFSVEGIRDGRQQGSLSLSEDFGFVTRLDWTPDRQLKPGARFFERKLAEASHMTAKTPSRQHKVEAHQSLKLIHFTTPSPFSHKYLVSYDRYFQSKLNEYIIEKFE